MFVCDFTSIFDKQIFRKRHFRIENSNIKVMENRVRRKVGLLCELEEVKRTETVSTARFVRLLDGSWLFGVSVCPTGFGRFRAESWLLNCC